MKYRSLRGDYGAFSGKLEFSDGLNVVYAEKLISGVGAVEPCDGFVGVGPDGGKIAHGCAAVGAACEDHVPPVF